MTKIEQLFNECKALQPLKDEDLARLNRKFMLEFNYNSNHLEGNTLTYGQTELLLLFGKVSDVANMKDLEEMKASNVGLKMMQEQALSEYPLTETFIRQLHKTLLREDYTVYQRLPGGETTSYIIHAGQYKTRPNSVMTITGERFEYASPEETPALMTDLVNWYNAEEKKGELTLPQLCALFHYRYIRIHPFEDGNGRIARLLVNYILIRHNYPMIVVQSSDKDNYLGTLNICDTNAGATPSEGASAQISQIEPFVSYIEKCMKKALRTCIKAAKGESIEDDDDFVKELKILEKQKKQDLASEKSKLMFCEEELWNVLDYVYFPIVDGFKKAIKSADDVFSFTKITSSNLLSKTKDVENGLIIDSVNRNTSNTQIIDYARNAKSMWFNAELSDPTNPKASRFTILKSFYIAFFDDHYFVDGIMNVNFCYGKYPSTDETSKIIQSFKQEILAEIREKM